MDEEIKEYLISKGFKYIDKQEWYQLNKGFGKKLIVEKLMNGLWEVRANARVIYTDFLSSSSDIINRVNNLI